VRGGKLDSLILPHHPFLILSTRQRRPTFYQTGYLINDRVTLVQERNRANIGIDLLCRCMCLHILSSGSCHGP